MKSRPRRGSSTAFLPFIGMLLRGTESSVPFTRGLLPVGAWVRIQVEQSMVSSLLRYILNRMQLLCPESRSQGVSGPDVDGRVDVGFWDVWGWHWAG